MDKISIIIPVYNVETYIHKCIGSVLAQTYRNIEVILVDDGSPDNSGIICDEYAKKDKRVIVIHKKNGGLSDARNAGIDAATGDYIVFVDSDDYIAPDMIEKLYETQKRNNADITVCGYRWVEFRCTIIIESVIISVPLTIELPYFIRWFDQSIRKEHSLHLFGCHSWCNLVDSRYSVLNIYTLYDVFIHTLTDCFSHVLNYILFVVISNNVLFCFHILNR